MRTRVLNEAKRRMISFRNFLEEDEDYDENQYEFSMNVVINKEVGGNREQTFAELRAIDDITIVKQEPHSGTEDDGNYYSKVIIRFIPDSVHDVSGTLRGIIDRVGNITGLVRATYNDDLQKISGPEAE
jgi:hypothetical protein